MNHSSLRDLTPLALARKKRGWTQAYVAEQVGVSIDAVRRWESGRLPYPASIQELCRLFALSPQELGLFTGPQRQLPSERWEPDDAEKQAAWEIYIELVTRIPLAILEEDQGILREALSSLYSLLQITRTILRRLGPRPTPSNVEPVQSFSYLAVSMLNIALRPLLAKWHPLLKDYEERRPSSVGILEYERKWEKYAELRQEIASTRHALLTYASTFAKLAGTSSLITDALPVFE